MTHLLDIPVQKPNGHSSSLSEYSGKVILVVNVASKCGLTPQYEGLQALYRKYRDKGFEIAAFPANDFLGQEPGTDDEIKDFCETTYGVEFPLFSKIHVVGSHKHPLYVELTRLMPKATSTTDGELRKKLREYGIAIEEEPEILWNFEKFVISRSGKPVARFAPDTPPDDPALIAAIENALNATGAN